MTLKTNMIQVLFQQKNLNLHKVDIFKEMYPETFRNRYAELVEKKLLKE
jgi:hypothetical protein